MGWRKIQREDIERGVIIRLKKMEEDGAYALATIIATALDGPLYKHIKVSRPMALAHEHFDSNTGLLQQEVFTIGLTNLLAVDSDVEVFQGRDGLRKMST